MGSLKRLGGYIKTSKPGLVYSAHSRVMSARAETGQGVPAEESHLQL